MAELAITFAETDHVTGACRHIYATGPNGEMSVSFRRTSRVPLNERMFYTPDLGLFPLYKVDRFHGLPNSVRKVGGWFIAMRDQEAMFIDFNSNKEFNVTVASDASKEAHCFVNGQFCLDGMPDDVFPNCVRQFLAAPASSRSSASPVAGTAFGTLTLNVKPSLAVFEVPDPSSTFSINVKTLTGKILPFEIHSLTTCEQLKVAIEYREGVPKDQQRVIFGGKQVTDATVLSQLGIVEASVVHMVLRLRGGGMTLARPFASHRMTLKPGGLVWQPQIQTEEPSIASAETSTVIPIHILNAEHVRAWTGIDPPQSLVDPELYTTVGIPFVSSSEEAESLAEQNAALYDQLYEHQHGSNHDGTSTDSPSSRLKGGNPFTAIKSRNAKSMAGVDQSTQELSLSSSTNVGGDQPLVDEQKSGRRKRVWDRLFYRR